MVYSIIPLLFSTLFAVAITPNTRFEGVLNTGLEGVIQSGEVETTQTDPVGVEKEIKRQLSYWVGALNGWGGTFDWARTEIKLGEKNEITGRWKYAAKLFISWPKNFQIPQFLSFPVPLRADSEGLKDYFQRYSQGCSVDPNSSDLGIYSFFYYYRPQNSQCFPSLPGTKPANVSYSTIKVGFSSFNTQGKSPEYEKIWEDGELTATILVGTNHPGNHSNSDLGIFQYNSMYRYLRSSFGIPSAFNVSLPANALPGMSYPDIEMTFNLGNGKTFNISLLLLDKNQLLYPTADFRARVEDRMERSDFVSYNGHSGLGSNIRALAAMAKAKPGKYQVFYINGCDTFSYVDSSLADLHEKANPSFGKYKFFDLIANSMPSLFSGFSVSNSALINAFIGKKSTYRAILEQFEWHQRAVVIGEEDNV